MSGKVALVVGGSCGIGAAVCRDLLGDGCKVACTHLGQERDNEGAASLHKLAESLGGQCEDKAINCVDNDATAQFAEAIENKWGRIDYLVYCAGYTTPVPFQQLTADEWRRVVDINLNGAFIAIHAVLPAMLRQGGGGIVMIGSAAVTSGGGGRADYVSAKAGMEGLNLAITKEFSKNNVRCNIVHPSLSETDLLRTRHPDPAKRAEVARGVPLGRLGQPEDVSPLVCFLLSENAGYITGQAILVDGGRSYCGK